MPFSKYVAAAMLLSLVSVGARAGQRSMGGTYSGKHGGSGTWNRTVSSSGGTYQREGSWSGTNGSGSYQGAGTRGGGSGTFDGTFTRNGGGTGTIQTVTQATADGHVTSGTRTKPNGETHDFDRTRTRTADGYIISGTNTSAAGRQTERQTVDANGVAVTTITRPDGTVVTSSRTGRTGSN